MSHLRATPTDPTAEPGVRSEVDRTIGRGIDRRRFLQALIASPILYGLVTACGSVTGDNVQSLRSDQTRAAGGDPAVAAAALNAFGNDLFTVLAADTDGTNNNVVYSPTSIAIALAMVLGGAAGGTRSEMASVLHVGDVGATNLDAQIETFHSSMNSLVTALSQRSHRDRSGGREGRPAEVQLDIASSLWGQSGVEWKPAFLDLLAEQYGAGLGVVNFADDPGGAADAINTWVADATNQMIDDLVDETSLTEATRLVLANAVYLKATWLSPFEPESTSDADFTTGSGDVVSVPTMNMSDRFRAAETDTWQAVELPYSFNQLSMVIAVGAGPTEPDAPQLAEVVSEIDDRDVVLSLPKFNLTSRLSLAKILEQLGMSSAFGAGADFSAMTNEQLFISEIVHEARINVDEDGTEAAAATSNEMSGAIEREDEPLTITIDRPFTFWLRDRVTGAVIFTGRVNDPRQ